MIEHQIYQSPFSWRYGSDEMRQIWSLSSSRRLWRRIWVALAEAQIPYGLVSDEQLQELKDNQDQLDLERSLALEAELHHDLAAELSTFAGQCPLAGGVIHLGATSMDIKDNALVLQQKAALQLILSRLRCLLETLAERIEQGADQPVMGYTHLQPAEPSTLGYRLAQPAQDLLIGYQDLRAFGAQIMGKGFTGAVGTSASFAVLLGEENLPAFQEKISASLGLAFYPAVTQTYPRLQDYRLLSLLAGVGAALYKLSFDLRVLQSPAMGEIAESFGEHQVGSSAMPFKQNPIRAEKVDSLGRYLAQLPHIAWDNAAHSLLERTLDDSANRRMILPEAFLCLEEMLITSAEILSGLRIHPAAIQANLAQYGPFAATEELLMHLSKAGADRQVMHEIIREHAAAAWEQVRQGEDNPLVDLLAGDSRLQDYFPEVQLRDLLGGSSYLGDAPQRARMIAAQIRKLVES